MIGGTLGGTGTLTTSGSSTWNGGTMSGAGRTVFNGAVALSGAAVRNVAERTVDFNDTTTWTNASSGFFFQGINTGSGATLNNNGTWLDQTTFAVGITSALGGAPAAFNNNGSYFKSGPTSTTFSIAFNNTTTGVGTGVVSVSNGNLVLGGGGTSNGRFDVGSGASVSLAGGSHALNGINGGGGGTLQVSGGSVNATGTNVFGGTLGLSGGVLDLAGTFQPIGLNMTAGTLGGTGTLTTSGSSTWNGGTMSGAGRTVFNGAVALSGAAVRNVAERTVDFNDTTTWTNASSGFFFQGINTGSGATLNNNGTWLDQTTFAVSVTSALGGAKGTFNNNGFYVKSGDSSTDLSAINYVNNGTTDAQRGAIILPSNFTNPGTLKGQGRFVASNITNTGHVAPGESPGTLTMTSNFVQTAAGFFDIELQSAGNHDLLAVTGSVALDGTLELICFGDCRMAVGQSLTILDGSPNQLSGTFANVALIGFATGEFDVVYDVAVGDVRLDVTVATTPVPEPTTTVLWLAGMTMFTAFARRRRERIRL